VKAQGQTDRQTDHQSQRVFFLGDLEGGASQFVCDDSSLLFDLFLEVLNFGDQMGLVLAEHFDQRLQTLVARLLLSERGTRRRCEKKEKE
jgi:hypothetical protein